MESRRLLTDFIVTSTADAGDGTLRQAIVDANGQAGADRILFDIPASDAGHVYYQDDGVAGRVSIDNVANTTQADDANISDIDPDWPHSWYSIVPELALPAVTSSITIDGYTQPGAVENTLPAGHGLDTVLRVELSGKLMGLLPDGMLHLAASDSVIKGLAINRAQGTNIYVEQEFFDRPAGTNRVEGNFLGTDVSGSVAFEPGPNSSTQRHDGVRIRGSSDNVIGGSTPPTRNLISGNRTIPAAGVFVEGAVASRNSVRGNLIGTTRDGNHEIANSDGVHIASNGGHQVGGPNVSDGNVISGNSIAGLIVGGRNVRVENNWIGTTATNSTNVGNSGVGILVAVNASSAQIFRNTVAYNGQNPPMGGLTGTTSPAGVRILGALFPSLDSPVGNGNVISQNSIHSNFGVGIDLNGGVLGEVGITPNDVPPESSPPDGDLGPNGLQNFPVLSSVTETAGGIRALGALASRPDSTFRIEFFANTHRDESLRTLVDPFAPTFRTISFGEGESYIGSIEVMTDNDGIVEFVADLPPRADGLDFITSTATDITESVDGARNNTSEFSPLEPVGGCRFVVTDTDDDGVGSFREAMTCSSLADGPQTIVFDIPTDDPRHFYYRDDGVPDSVSRDLISAIDVADDANLPTAGVNAVDPDWPHSWFSIQLQSALPEHNSQFNIDGYSQPGSRRNSIPAPGELDTVLKIELDGSQHDGDGFALPVGAEVSRIEGLAINRFGGNGIFLDTFGGIVVGGNFVGTDVSGTVDLGNRGSGIFLNRERDKRIGATLHEMRNLVSGNESHGIEASVVGASVIAGNLIGTDRTAQRSLQNDGDGVRVDSSFFITVGGQAPGAGNVIHSGSGNGISVLAPNYDPSRPANTLDELGRCQPSIELARQQRNGFFETNDLDQHLELSDTIDDILLCAAIEGLIGQSQLNDLVGNAITTHGAGLAIDLQADGVTPNDPGDADGGGNNFQNYPVLTSATTENGTTTVSGDLNSNANAAFRIEFFANISLHDSGFGGGQRPLGFTDVMTDNTGNAAFTFTSPAVVPSRQFVAATTTRLFDIDNDPLTASLPLETSEFSAGIQVSGEASGNINGVFSVELESGYTPMQFTIPVALGPSSSLKLVALSSLDSIGPQAVDILLASDGPVTGEFSQLPDVRPELNGTGRGHLGHGVFFTGVRYNEGLFGVAVDVFQAGSGDADGDGDIDFVDFLTLANNFGQRGTWVQGDFNDDGQIEFNDFLTLAAAFGINRLA